MLMVPSEGVVEVAELTSWSHCIWYTGVPKRQVIFTFSWGKSHVCL
jgi:hypothetical protein